MSKRLDSMPKSEKRIFESKGTMPTVMAPGVGFEPTRPWRATGSQGLRCRDTSAGIFSTWLSDPGVSCRLSIDGYILIGYLVAWALVIRFSMERV